MKTRLDYPLEYSAASRSAPSMFYIGKDGFPVQVKMTSDEDKEERCRDCGQTPDEGCCFYCEMD